MRICLLWYNHYGHNTGLACAHRLLKEEVGTVDFSFGELYAFILALMALILTHITNAKKKDKDDDKQEK
jgi:hypothetical protein